MAPPLVQNENTGPSGPERRQALETVSLRLDRAGVSPRNHHESGPDQGVYPMTSASPNLVRVRLAVDWLRRWWVMLTVALSVGLLTGPLWPVVATAAQFWWHVLTVAVPAVLSVIGLTAQTLDVLSRIEAAYRSFVECRRRRSTAAV